MDDPHPDFIEDIWNQGDRLKRRAGTTNCEGDDDDGTGSKAKRASLIKAVGKWKRYRYQEFGFTEINRSHACRSNICGPLANDTIVLIDESLKLYGCVISGNYHACDGSRARTGGKTECKYTTLNQDGTVTCSFSGRMVDVFIDPSKYKVTEKVLSDYGGGECEDDLLAGDNYEDGEGEDDDVSGEREENPMTTAEATGFLGGDSDIPGGAGEGDPYSYETIAGKRKKTTDGTGSRLDGTTTTTSRGGGDNKKRHREKRRKFYAIQNNVTDAFEQLKFEEYEPVASEEHPNAERPEGVKEEGDEGEEGEEGEEGVTKDVESKRAPKDRNEKQQSKKRQCFVRPMSEMARSDIETVVYDLLQNNGERSRINDLKEFHSEQSVQNVIRKFYKRYNKDRIRPDRHEIETLIYHASNKNSTVSRLDCSRTNINEYVRMILNTWEISVRTEYCRTHESKFHLRQHAIGLLYIMRKEFVFDYMGEDGTLRSVLLMPGDPFLEENLPHQNDLDQWRTRRSAKSWQYRKNDITNGTKNFRLSLNSIRDPRERDEVFYRIRDLAGIRGEI